jgi:hypothetical protein
MARGPVLAIRLHAVARRAAVASFASNSDRGKRRANSAPLFVRETARRSTPGIGKMMQMQQFPEKIAFSSGRGQKIIYNARAFSSPSRCRSTI